MYTRLATVLGHRLLIVFLGLRFQAFGKRGMLDKQPGTMTGL